MIHERYSYYKNRTVLITGGAGFIGSHLCDALIEHGAHVHILDDLSHGSLQNIAHHKNNITFFKGSVEHKDDCLAAMKGVTDIVHLAAEVSVTACQEDPYKALMTNIQGTATLLEAARIHKGIDRFIFASSAAVYGNYEGICTEDSIPQPLSTYGHSKLMGEHLCKLYAESYGIKTVILRFFNVYGPRQKSDSGVLSVFDNNLKQNKPLAIFGDGSQTRDFIQVTTIVHALLKAGMLPAHMAQGEIFNIGSGKSVTLKSKLHELLEQYPLYNQPITYLPERPGDIKHSVCDCSKFEKVVL